MSIRVNKSGCLISIILSVVLTLILNLGLRACG
jgi:hypothetical protein